MMKRLLLSAALLAALPAVASAQAVGYQCIAAAGEQDAVAFDDTGAPSCRELSPAPTVNGGPTELTDVTVNANGPCSVAAGVVTCGDEDLSNNSANPTATVGLSATNGSANTFMRSDAAPALSQAIAPTWTGTHVWDDGVGDSPPARFQPQTGTTWELYVEDATDDLQIQSASTAATETVDIVNPGAGVANLSVEGSITQGGNNVCDDGSICTGYEADAHESEHRENAADELLGENLGTSCAENQILKANATGGLDCAADATGGSPTFDQIGTGTNTTATMTVGTGASLIASGSGTITATSTPSQDACSEITGCEAAANGIQVRTAADTKASRTITGDAEIVVADGDGVAGNPTLSVGSGIARDSELPLAQQYLVLSADANLTGERVYTAGLGFACVDGGAGNAYTCRLGYAQTTAGNPALGANECVFTSSVAGGAILCEGSVADDFEATYALPDVTGADAARTIATLTAAQTFSTGAKTFNAGILTVGATSWTNANHAHTAANSGGALGASSVSGGAAGIIADGTIVGQDIADAYAGRSLTETSNFLDADAELYTDTVSFNILNNLALTDDGAQWEAPVAVTITQIDCSTNAGTATIQFDERTLTTPNTAGTDVMAAGLVCDTDNQQQTSFSNAGIAAGALLNLDVDALSGSAQLRVHVRYTKDD